MSDDYGPDLTDYYDADTLRAFTNQEYEIRKLLFAQRHDARRSAEKAFWALLEDGNTSLLFDRTVDNWGTLAPLIEAYVRIDAEVRRLDPQV